MDAKRTKGASGCCRPLPEEIMEDILSRLPAKSLCRFRCVSRSFRAVISSRAFQDTHYHHQRRRSSGGDRRLFIRPAAPGVQKEPLYYAWRLGGGGDETTIIMSSARRLPQGSIFPVSKSCRGLVLLKSTGYRTHYVWNPSTGEVSALPDKIPPMARLSWGFVPYGLCYCPATRRHKVVRMYDACGRNGYGATPATICEVFTLDESAYWRPVATQPPPCHPRENWRQGGVVCNGNLHFLDHSGGIVVFNVGDETFGTLLIRPPPDLQRWSSNFELTELGGSLCVYSTIAATEEGWGSHRRHLRLVHVWLLKDYGTADAKWEKLCSVGDEDDDAPQADDDDRGLMLKSSYWIAPLDMYYDSASNQKKIVFGTNPCNIFIVDPIGGTTKLAFSFNLTTTIGAQPPCMGFFEESLALVGALSENAITLASPPMRAWSEVLSRLPARAVRSLSHVCRGWRAVTKTEHFVAAHLYRANCCRPPLQIAFFSCGMPYEFEPVEKYINAPVPPPLIDSRCRIICSKPCHGLNVWSFASYDLVFNPAMSYFKALPPPPPGTGGSSSAWGEGGLSAYDDLVDATSFSNNIGAASTMFAGRLGLGYEQGSSRHVLVRLAYSRERNLATRGDYEMVCNMRYVQDMVWDEVDPPPRPIANMPPTHVKGKLYWMVDTELVGQRPPPAAGLEIIELDVSTRKFEVLQGPPCGGEHCTSIIELQGMVCVTCSHRTMGSTIRIWAMDNQDTAAAGVTCWSVKYDIELGRFSPEFSPDKTVPLAVCPEDGRILLSTGRALGYYNPTTAELETFYSLGKHAEGMKFVPILFQESLVNPCHSSV